MDCLSFSLCSPLSLSNFLCLHFVLFSIYLYALEVRCSACCIPPGGRNAALPLCVARPALVGEPLTPCGPVEPIGSNDPPRPSSTLSLHANPNYTNMQEAAPVCVSPMYASVCSCVCWCDSVALLCVRAHVCVCMHIMLRVFSSFFSPSSLLLHSSKHSLPFTPLMLRHLFTFALFCSSRHLLPRHLTVLWLCYGPGLCFVDSH